MDRRAAEAWAACDAEGCETGLACATLADAADHTLPSPNLDVGKLIGSGESGGSLDERIIIVARVQVDRSSDLVLNAEQIEAIGLQAALPRKGTLTFDGKAIHLAG